MLKRTTKGFRKDFVLEFTKELIRSTETYRNLKVKKEVKIVLHEKPQKLPPRQDVREAVKEKIKRDSVRVSKLKEIEPFAEFFRQGQKPIRKIFQPLHIPEPILPPTVQYHPLPTMREINLGKLNPLVKDPLVRIIECNGPEEKLIVMGAMGRKNTSIILNKEQIDEVIQKFSEASKIPVHEGFFRVVYGRLILAAIVSEIIGSKFLIKKMPGPPVSFGG